MEHKNPFIRLLAYGRIKKLMNEFEGKPMSDLEKNMMLGLF